MGLLLMLQAVWGLPQTLAGLVMLCANRRCKRTRYRAAYVTTWKKQQGLSLGPFIFVPPQSPRQLIVHEYGHTVQSLILGPLYLPLIGLPSVVWACVPALGRWRRAHHMSYYALPTERWANALGEWVCKEPSMGQAFVD